jgi:hypothetical protein
MVAVLLYAYANGIYSSRRIAKACVERADFMMLVALEPDFRTIAEFRRRHLRALGGLFVQVLRLAAKMGLVKLGHVAVDGTKIKANASKHKAMSYERMTTHEAELARVHLVAGALGRQPGVHHRVIPPRGVRDQTRKVCLPISAPTSSGTHAVQVFAPILSVPTDPPWWRVLLTPADWSPEERCARHWT